MMENEFEVTVRQTLAKTTSVFTEAVHQCVERDYDATAGGYAYTSFAEPDWADEAVRRWTCRNCTTIVKVGKMKN